MPQKAKRQLVAILFADIVGYTAMMQKDEQQASSIIRHFQKQLEEKVAFHNGQVVNFYGDGALCTFQVPIDAVRCAMALQTNFQNEPKTPVRVGIHSGSVTYEGDKIFGDSVNITSRIESMGVAGGILFSKKIRDEVKNNPDLQMQSLGNFEFKNVEEPMEVFALTNEGFIVPKPAMLKGKFKTQKTPISNWRMLTIVATLLLSLFGYLKYSSSSNSLSLSESNTKEPVQTPLSKEAIEKRVVVMVFENQTMDSELGAFGKMISDWITRGLMETGEANVISAANIQHQINQTELGQEANPEFATNTGVEIMIQGRYYLQESQLIIHANIVEIESGEVLHALTPIEGNKVKMLDLLDELTQEITGFWAVKNAKRFLQNPPKYEAWKKFVEANSLFSSDFQKAELLFKEAFRLDTTFFAPIIKLSILYKNSNLKQSNYAASDSLKKIIRGKLPVLTKWERLRWEASEAANDGDFLKAAILSEQLYQMDKSDANANYNVGVLFWLANYPQKALSVLNDLDPRFRNRNKDISYMEWLVASIYNDIGAHQKAIETVQTYSYPKLYIGNANAHLTALIGLGKYDLLETQLSNYLQEKDIQSDKKNVAQLYRTVCNQLLVKSEGNRLKKYATQFKSWLYNENYIAESLEHQIYIEIYLGNYNQAITLIKKVKPSKMSPNFRNELPMLLGVCYAKKGDFANASKQIEQVLNHNYISRFHGLEYYNSAKIEVAMNQKDAAVASLKKAIGQGIPYGDGRFKNDGLLNSLFDYPSFEELVKTKER